MSSCDDPFTVLGVRREASLDEVKRAYRRLAMQWHPDRNPSVAAEAEFRRVHAAYELFLDPQRMAEWQQAQTTMTDAAEPAGNLGDDWVQPLELTLEEAALGCRKDIELVDRVGCRHCCGSGKVRINKAGCMDRCDSGPVLVVYPDAVWYSYVDNEDIEEIIQEHLVHGRVVERLRI